MKQIVCEMCGSTDIQKEGGVFVCRGCGCKYSLEEAKKLMVEVENSPKLDNLYDRARKSLEVEDYAHASEYYKQILDEKPDDWEAYFYFYLYETATFTNGEAATVASKLSKTIPSAYDIAIKNCDAEEATERIKTITTRAVDRIAYIAATAESLLQSFEDKLSSKTSFAENSVNLDLYAEMLPTGQSTLVACSSALDTIDEKIISISNENSVIAPDVYKECSLYIRRKHYAIVSLYFVYSQLYVKDGKGYLFKLEYIRECIQKVKKLDPSFEPSQQVQNALNPSSSSGCYVATAVYGSYDCPQVWTLRRFRDYTLAETWYDRAFIRTYYAISPTLVRWFGHTDWFKKMWKGKLDRMVADLQAKGVEDTPYEDRNW